MVWQLDQLERNNDMKRQHHTLHPSRGARLRSLFFALLSGSMFLYSCADDLSSSASSRQLTFTPTVSSSWNQGTRSVSGPDVPQSTVTALEGYSRPPLSAHVLYRQHRIPWLWQQDHYSRSSNNCQCNV